MAKNWTLKEAAAVLAAGSNKEEIAEIAKRFPITSVAIAKTGTSKELLELLNGIPDHVTMLKVERNFKDGVEEDIEDDVEDDVEAAETEKAIDSPDLSAMTTKELYELCIKKGIKAAKFHKPKQYYLDLLKAGKTTNKPVKEEVEEAEEIEDEFEDEVAEETEEEEVVDYKTMSAIELFKLCKSRGIKAEPKKKVAEYVKLLEADDAANAEEDEEEDDWDI